LVCDARKSAFIFTPLLEEVVVAINLNKFRPIGFDNAFITSLSSGLMTHHPPLYLLPSVPFQRCTFKCMAITFNYISYIG
jgi:hypothetical protein